MVRGRVYPMMTSFRSESVVSFTSQKYGSLRLEADKGYRSDENEEGYQVPRKAQCQNPPASGRGDPGQAPS